MSNVSANVTDLLNEVKLPSDGLFSDIPTRTRIGVGIKMEDLPRSDDFMSAAYSTAILQY